METFTFTKGVEKIRPDPTPSVQDLKGKDYLFASKAGSATGPKVSFGPKGN